jgi:hypothetical protein
MSDNSINVPWPPLALGEAGWRRRLRALLAAELAIRLQNVFQLDAAICPLMG